MCLIAPVMKILLVAATLPEIQPFIHSLEPGWTSPAPGIYTRAGHELHTCITGVGIMAATYAITRALAQPYDMALQAGVAGSFDRNIALGQLALVNAETLGDLGAEDHENFLDVYDLQLAGKEDPPYTNGRLVNPLHKLPLAIDLPHADSLTVNTVSGSARTIAMRAAKFGCKLESMEGAPFHYACLMAGLPFAQVRAVSNYVTPRDKSQWKMKEAIIALNKWLAAFVAALP